MELIKDTTEVRSAYQLLKDSVTNHTPLQYDRYLSQKKYQATVLLKREDLQKFVHLNYAVLIMPLRNFQRRI